MKTQITTPSERLVKPFAQFAKLESSGGIVLIISTVLALIFANSPLASEYRSFLNIKITIGISQFQITEPIIFWINDGLMSLFFLVVGLEIKREILEGDLSSFKHAALPVAAAIGGMIIPALIYFGINFGKASSQGWAIPMATDIAFSLGILMLLGKKIPSALKAFVATLAIADDLGGILVIALFYTSDISKNAIIAVVIIVMALIIINRLRTRHPAPYFLFGTLLWIAFLKAGLHPTLSGVLLALLIPSSYKINTKNFIKNQQALLKKLRPSIEKRALTHEEYQATMEQLSSLNKQFEAPMTRLNRALLPWVTFFITPLFAFANAGIEIFNNLNNVLTSPVTLGVAFGLIVGKMVGITSFSWLAVKSGLGALPKNVNFRHIIGASMLCAIGFTVAIFIATISFNSIALINEAKIGILFASIIAGSSGYIFLRANSKKESK